MSHHEKERLIELDGLTVGLFRSQVDGMLVVSVTNEPEDMQPRDLAPDNAPRFRLNINDCDDAYLIDENGEGVIP